MTPVGNAGHYVISCEHWVIRHSNLITRLWPSLHNRWHQGNGSVIYWPHWQYELCRPIITHKTRKKGQFFFWRVSVENFTHSSLQLTLIVEIFLGCLACTACLRSIQRFIWMVLKLCDSKCCSKTVILILAVHLDYEVRFRSLPCQPLFTCESLKVGKLLTKCCWLCSTNKRAQVEIHWSIKLASKTTVNSVI